MFLVCILLAGVPAYRCALESRVRTHGLKITPRMRDFKEEARSTSIHVPRSSLSVRNVRTICSIPSRFRYTTRTEGFCREGLEPKTASTIKRLRRLIQGGF